MVVVVGCLMRFPFSFFFSRSYKHNKNEWYSFVKVGKMTLPSTANLLTTAGIASAYLILYSGYDKATSQYQITKKLSNLFSFKNPTASIVELNKAIGLTAMSLANATALSLLLQRGGHVSASTTKELGWTTAVLAGVHGVYSGYKYRSRFFSGPKVLPMFLGPISLWALFAWNDKLGNFASPRTRLWFTGFSELPSFVSSAASTTLAAVSSALLTTHVFLMEQNAATGKLAMRPAGVAGLIGSFVASGVLIVSCVL